MFFDKNKRQETYISARIISVHLLITIVQVSRMMIVILISLFIFVPLINGLIIGTCQEPNEWKTWLNVHRPTTYG